jgi:hypothetical protein
VRERSRSERAYAALLYLYPPSFRRAYHRQMADCFRDRVRSHAGGRLELWVSVLLDLARHAAGEWMVRTTGRGALRSLSDDLRYSLRCLIRQPLFSAVTVATLAVGIGSTTFVYSVVEAQLLRPVPFGVHGDRLLTLHSTHPSQPRDWDDSRVSYPDLLDLRAQARAFAALEGILPRNLSVRAGADAERIEGASTPRCRASRASRSSATHSGNGASAAIPGSSGGPSR